MWFVTGDDRLTLDVERNDTESRSWTINRTIDPDFCGVPGVTFQRTASYSLSFSTRDRRFGSFLKHLVCDNLVVEVRHIVLHVGIG